MVKNKRPTVWLGDGLSGLHSLPAGSAGLILSDLPSGATRAPFDTRPDLSAMWPAIWHAAGDTGVVVVLASSLSFAAELLQTQRRWFRHDLIWRKSLATGFLNAGRAPLRAHEFILVFSRKAPTYHPQMWESGKPVHDATRSGVGANYNSTESQRSRAGQTDRFPVSVLDFASVGTSSKNRTHPQQKPVPLLRWLVRSYSEKGDLVIDPYAGSGSSGVAALAEDRLFVGWDSDPRFGAEASLCERQRV